LTISAFDKDPKEMKLSTATLGFPRMGPNRELKFALEKHWNCALSEADLLTVARSVEEEGWALQQATGIDRIAVGDFALYDAVLMWTEMLGMVPAHFAHLPRGTARLFAMARGIDGAPALSKSGL
jgi:5-methyltetrahydropteroyltriglutamate--homocysteine methyltransferase